MEKYAPVVNPEVSLGVDLGRTKEASFPGMLRMEGLFCVFVLYDKELQAASWGHCVPGWVQ